eukprot:NODE_12_length_45166_cov_0.552511.p9 type:complete len:368 gc:universal NODE_12_length_45166_cov_0.552511:39582-40685(+)
MKHYAIIEEIGSGSYGTVFKAVDNENGTLVALKQVTMEDESIMKEIEFMKSCNNEYIIGLDNYYTEDDVLYIAMEFCPAGSIADVMKYTEKTLVEKQLQSVLRDALHGLNYLHKRLAIHRDIKAGNLLLNRQGRVKLGDFGVSANLSDAVRKRNTVIGTPYWMAPEIIQEIGYNTSADIWSLGITAIECADGKPPYHHIHPMRAIFMIPNKPSPTVSEPSKWSTICNSFISQCLNKSPDTRPTAETLLKHEFIQSAPDSSILLELVQLSLELKSKKKSDLEKGGQEIVERLEELHNGTVKQSFSLGTTVYKPNDQYDSGTTVFNSTIKATTSSENDDDWSKTVKPARKIIDSQFKTIRPNNDIIDVL